VEDEPNPERQLKNLWQTIYRTLKPFSEDADFPPTPGDAIRLNDLYREARRECV